MALRRVIFGLSVLLHLLAMNTSIIGFLGDSDDELVVIIDFTTIT